MMKLAKLYRVTGNLLLLIAAGLAAPLSAPAASRTFQSLAVAPAATNIIAGATVTAAVSLSTKASSGSTASGAVILYVGSISPFDPGISTGINPASYMIGTGAASNSILTVTTTAGTPANTYVISVVGTTNPAAVGNPTTPITNTYTLTVTSGAAERFTMAMSPASSIVFRGAATNVDVSVNFLDYSATISDSVTNAVTVLPFGQGVSASLNSLYAPITNNFGQTNLVLAISATANAAAGAYQVIVRGTNGNFTANSPVAGTAAVTNIFTVIDANSFSMSVSPASTNLVGGVASHEVATVTFTDNSPFLSGELTNGVTVSPEGQGVTAKPGNDFVSINSGGGGTLTVTVNATADATPGTYQVIIGATNNAFTANTPVPGIALVTNLFIVTSPPPVPAFQYFSVSGTTLAIMGSNGTPDGQYVIFAATNLALPLAQWTPVVTNAFDGAGNFSASFGLANTSNPGAAQQFFTLLQQTNLLSGVVMPAFNPPAAPYYAETPVTIASATAGATIHYTTDGSTPTRTHGTLYTGPVTMQQAVYTNMTGFVTNCSGITMLKAVAYKGGMADSPVFTGNYVIIVPLRYAQTSSLVLGLAHLAYNVSSSNWNSVLNLWTGYLGYDTLVVSNGFALIKINDQQYIELYQRPIVAPQYQLANYGFYVSDVEAFRQHILANGVTVPSGVTTNALGNLSFFTTDPDGHVNEWVQYLPDSVTGRSLGQHLPGTQLFGYLQDYGDATADVTAAGNYYTQCDFSGTGTKVYLPNNNCYLEMLTYSSFTQAVAGKHEKAQLVTFRGTDVLTAANILQTRDSSIVQTPSTEGGGDFPTHNCVDVYDTDLSRIRMIDINF